MSVYSEAVSTRTHTLLCSSLPPSLPGSFDPPQCYGMLTLAGYRSMLQRVNCGLEGGRQGGREGGREGVSGRKWEDGRG